MGEKTQQQPQWLAIKSLNHMINASSSACTTHTKNNQFMKLLKNKNKKKTFYMM